MKVPSRWPAQLAAPFIMALCSASSPSGWQYRGDWGGGQKQTAIQHIYPAAAGTQRGIVTTGTGCSRSTAGYGELSLSLRGMFPDLIRIWRNRERMTLPRWKLERGRFADLRVKTIMNVAIFAICPC